MADPNQLQKASSFATADQAIENVYNQVDKTISTTSFITSKIGNKIVRTLPSSDTEEYAYYDGDELLYTIQIIYTDSTLQTIESVERTT